MLRRIYWTSLSVALVMCDFVTGAIIACAARASGHPVLYLATALMMIAGILRVIRIAKGTD